MRDVFARWDFLLNNFRCVQFNKNANRQLKSNYIMYEDYTRQSLPSKLYRELLGTAICVFNSNNQFVIENILKVDDANYNWHNLIDEPSGKLHEPIKNTITASSNDEIAILFLNLVSKRNRIIHSFQITYQDEQILATKDKLDNSQFIITEAYLFDFIKDNETFSSKLHEFRGF